MYYVELFLHFDWYFLVANWRTHSCLFLYSIKRVDFMLLCVCVF